jgi:hypothetical protein
MLVKMSVKVSVELLVKLLVHLVNKTKEKTCERDDTLKLPASNGKLGKNTTRMSEPQTLPVTMVGDYPHS